jgi:hypothetical protein
MSNKLTIIFGSVLVIAGGLIAINLMEENSQPNEGGINDSSNSEAIESVGPLRQVELNTPSQISPDSDLAHVSNEANSVDFGEMRKRFDTHYDPMIVVARGEFSDAEIAAYNDLHILPFNRVTGENCREEQSQFDSNIFAKVCEVSRERPPHPYELLDSNDLISLADHDSVAALVLGQRTKDAEERIKYYLRAVALSGKSGPLLSLAEKRYSSFIASVSSEEGYTLVGHPDQLVNRLALETLAEKMGDPRANPDRWRKAVESQAFEDPNIIFADASRLTEKWLVNMKDIQQSVTGSTQMGDIH